MQQSNNNSLVWCKLPKAGLGNQLFPLLKALVFAHINNLPVIFTNYHQIKVGPYLRREKTKRKYNNYFVFQKGIIGEWLDRKKVNKRKFGRVVTEPELKISDNDSTLYCFHDIPDWRDLFAGLKEYRELAIDLLFKNIKPEIRTILDMYQAPEIGVHIRLGDFRRLLESEDFSKVGAVRTPQNYFITTINLLRSILGVSTHISIFTDGRREELIDILSLPEVSIVEGNPDIVDLLLLSKSEIIVTSAGSTFSYWAGFISDKPIILHPDHIHGCIRQVNGQAAAFEGSPNEFFRITLNKSSATTN